MYIFKEVDIEWGGEVKSLKVTFDVLRKIECSGFNLAKAAMEARSGAPLFTDVAILYSLLLKAVGIDVDNSTVFSALYGQGDDSQPEPNTIVLAVMAIMSAALPETAETEKPKKSKKTKATQK